MILRPGTTNELRHLARRMADTLSAGAPFGLRPEDYRLMNEVIEALEADAEAKKKEPKCAKEQ